jgi:hypothetical protein
MYSPPPPTFAFGHNYQSSSEGLPLIVVSPGVESFSGHGDTYDSFLPLVRSGSTYSGYSNHSVSSAERDVEMEVLEGVAPDTLVARRPVFSRERSEELRIVEDNGNEEGKGKGRE